MKIEYQEFSRTYKNHPTHEATIKSRAEKASGKYTNSWQVLTGQSLPVLFFQNQFHRKDQDVAPRSWVSLRWITWHDDHVSDPLPKLSTQYNETWWSEITPIHPALPNKYFLDCLPPISSKPLRNSKHKCCFLIDRLSKNQVRRIYLLYIFLAG